MILALFKRLRKVSNIASQDPMIDKYVWDDDCCNPEDEFLNTLQEFKIRHENPTFKSSQKIKSHRLPV